MDEFLQLYASRTRTADITITIATKHVVGKSYGNGKFTVATWACYQQSMGKTVLVDTTFQLLDNTFLPYYILKEYSHQ